MTQQKLIPLLLLIILGIFLFLRFSNIGNRIIFDWDQERFSTQVYNIVVHHKLTLLGPRTVNDRGFFLAPYFTYLMVPFFLISHMRPTAFISALFIIDILFFLSGFFIIKRIFNTASALLFLFIWSIGSMFVGYDMTPWNPVLMPLGVVLIWYILSQLLEKKDSFWWLLLGISLGFFINMHFQFIFIIIFALLFLGVGIKSGLIPFLRKNILYLFFGFIIMFSPQLLFDIRHQFLNLNLFIHFFTTSVDNMPKGPLNWVPVFTNAMLPFTYIKSEIVALLSYVLIIAITFFLSKTEKGFNKIFFAASSVLYLIIPLFFMIYGKRPSEYYFVIMYPYIIISIVYFFLKIKMGKLLLLLLFLYSLSQIQGNLINIQSKNFSLNAKDKAVRVLVDIVKGKKMNITYNMPLGANTGYTYLLTYYQVKQSGDFKDPLYQIDIPPQPDDLLVGPIGLNIPKK